MYKRLNMLTYFYLLVYNPLVPRKTEKDRFSLSTFKCSFRTGINIGYFVVLLQLYYQNNIS